MEEFEEELMKILRVKVEVYKDKDWNIGGNNMERNIRKIEWIE